MSAFLTRCNYSYYPYFLRDRVESSFAVIFVKSLKIQIQFKVSKTCFSFLDYCDRYVATVAMTALTVLAFTLAPSGILAYAVVKRMTSRYDVNEGEVSN